MKKLARKNVQSLVPYLSARKIGGEGDVWLNANESPFDNSYDIQVGHLNRYSECQPKALIEAYASYAGVRVEQVVTSRGADEGIDLLIRAYCEPGEDKILYCPPTYGMYSVSAESMGIEKAQAPLTQNWQLDLELIQANLQAVKLVFVCSPNNPTGNLLKRCDIISLLEMTKDKALVVVDEAYIDFCPEASTVDLLDRYSNLVILRTLSKAFALAGLRCGFTLANDETINTLQKVIAPYPVPVPVAEIAIQALSEAGLARVKYQVLDIIANRAYLQVGLSMLNQVQVFEGWGNYLLVKFIDGDALFKAAWDEGIILRNSPINNCLRISIGNRAECERTLEFIRNYYS